MTRGKVIGITAGLVRTLTNTNGFWLAFTFSSTGQIVWYQDMYTPRTPVACGPQYRGGIAMGAAEIGAYT